MALPETLPCKLPAPGGTMGDAPAGGQGTPQAAADRAGAGGPPCPDPRIAQYTERIGEHWVWRKPTMVNATGYPQLKAKGQYVSVHKWWEQVNGPVPEGMTLHHSCDVLYGKMCVWPGCMQVVTRERDAELRWERDRPSDA
jgi:hypothetical protein